MRPAAALLLRGKTTLTSHLSSLIIPAPLFYLTGGACELTSPISRLSHVWDVSVPAGLLPATSSVVFSSNGICGFRLDFGVGGRVTRWQFWVCVSVLAHAASFSLRYHTSPALFTRAMAGLVVKPLSSEEMLCCGTVFSRLFSCEMDCYWVQEVPHAKLEGAFGCFVCFYFLNCERICFKRVKS